MSEERAALGRWLCEEARALGFDDAALVRADEGTPRGADLERIAGEGRLEALEWLTSTLALRADLRQKYVRARTVLVVVQNYYTGDHAEHASGAELARGAKVSRYAWGGEYHSLMRKRLRKLRKRVLAKEPAAGVALFNDIDPVLERAWAEAAGLGFIGKSGLFIHRGFGTWTFLGGLVTDLELGAPSPIPPTHLCGTCTRCLEACPTAAIVAPGVVDAGRCLTTWNVERPGDPAGEAFAGAGWVAGCDVCQEVCPYNRFERVTTEERFAPRAGHVVLEEGGVPEDLNGTPLARPGAAGLAASTAWALRRRSSG
jgi:epoxyqueuosine reductase